MPDFFDSLDIESPVVQRTLVSYTLGASRGSRVAGTEAEGRPMSSVPAQITGGEESPTGGVICIIVVSKENPEAGVRY